MFPDLDLDTLVTEINESTEESSSAGTGRVFLMEFADSKATVVMENGRPKEASTTSEKVEMYAQVLIRTAYEKYTIYEDTDFGMTFYDYIGNRNMPSAFLNSELKREIEEKLQEITVVDSISDFSAELTAGTLTVNFTIEYTDDTDDTDVSVTV